MCSRGPVGEQCLPPFWVPFVPRLRCGRDRSSLESYSLDMPNVSRPCFFFDFLKMEAFGKQTRPECAEFHQRFQFDQQRNVKFEITWKPWKPCRGATAGAKVPRSRVFAAPLKLDGWTNSGSETAMVYRLLLSLSQPFLVAVGLNGPGGVTLSLSWGIFV